MLKTYNKTATVLLLVAMTAHSGENVAFVIGGGGEEGNHNAFKDEIRMAARALDAHGWNVSVGYDGTRDPMAADAFTGTDIQLSADGRSSTIEARLREIARRAEAGEIDQFLLQIDTHGSEPPDHQVWLEDGGYSVTRLRPLLREIARHGVRIGVVDQSCFSGATVDLLADEGWCVMSTQQDSDTSLHGTYVDAYFEEMEREGRRLPHRSGVGVSLEEATVRTNPDSNRQLIPEFSPFRGELAEAVGRLNRDLGAIYDVNRELLHEAGVDTDATEGFLENPDAISCRLLDDVTQIRTLIGGLSRASREAIERRVGASLASLVSGMSGRVAEARARVADYNASASELETCYGELEAVQLALGGRDTTGKLVYEYWDARREAHGDDHPSSYTVGRIRSTGSDVMSTLTEIELDRLQQLEETCLAADSRHGRNIWALDGLSPDFYQAAHRLQTYAYLSRTTDLTGQPIPNPCNRFELYRREGRTP